jgi:acetyl-CoA carboxylase biotin carboxyl carrier protein
MAVKKKTPPVAKSPAKPNAVPNDLQLIRSIADILIDTGLAEIEYNMKSGHIRVARASAHVVSNYAAPAPTSAPQPVAAAPVVAASAAAANPATSANAIKSPMVGTAYLAPSPGAAPFISVGDQVRQGQTLLIIEAMKTMNQITAERAGRVTHIYIDNSQPVEFGEPLLVLE